MGVSNTVEEWLWWIGWHRRHVSSVGIAVGFLGGYFGGSLGTAGLVTGLALAAGALYRKGILGLQVLVLATAAGVTYSLGFGGVVAVAGVEDIAETLGGAVLGLVGVEYTDPVSAAERGIRGVTFWYLTGFFLGFLVWSSGAVVVNRTYGDSYDAFRDLIRKKGEAILGEGTHTTVNGSGSLLGIRPNKEYHATNIRVRESSIDLNYGSALSMPRKAMKIKGSTKHLYYDQLASVNYDEPYFEIGMSGGEIIKIVTEEEPSGVLDEIERNLDRYKKSQEKEIGERKRRTQEAETEASTPDEEAERRAEEAMEDIESVEDVFESAIDEVDEKFEMVEDEDIGTEEQQVEVEKE
jgi:hypothetical protein